MNPVHACIHPQAKNEMEQILASPDIVDVPILVLANKNDVEVLRHLSLARARSLSRVYLLFLSHAPVTLRISQALPILFPSHVHVATNL
jgi:hypothetical protein